jgi:hypothetical protein
MSSSSGTQEYSYRVSAQECSESWSSTALRSRAFPDAPPRAREESALDCFWALLILVYGHRTTPILRHTYEGGERGQQRFFVLLFS